MRHITENEDDFVSGGMLIDRDQVLVVKPPHTLEDVIQAIKTVDNYGTYVSSMRGRKVTDKDLEAYFGPSSPRAKAALEKEKGIKFPVKTKQAIDDFIKKGVQTPDLLNYDIEDGNLVFTVERNPQRGKLRNIISTVMNNAGISYKLKDKQDSKKRKLKKVVKEVLQTKYKK
jgi:predicted secreted protein